MNLSRGEAKHHGKMIAFTRLIYQFGCTTDTVVYESFDNNKFLYSSNLYCSIPKYDSHEFNIVSHFSAIDKPPEEGENKDKWAYKTYPFSLDDQVEFGFKKKLNQQIQGISEPIFNLYNSNIYDDSDNQLQSLPVEKKYTAIDGVRYTYFIHNGFLLNHGLGLLHDTNTLSDITYDLTHNALGKSSSSCKEQNPQSDWYQVEWTCVYVNPNTRDRIHYKLMIDAMNRLYCWVMDEEATDSRRDSRDQLYNIHSAKMVQLELPADVVQAPQEFKQAYADGDPLYPETSRTDQAVQCYPRYHWKVRYDGLQVAAVVTVRSANSITPKLNRFTAYEAENNEYFGDNIEYDVYSFDRRLYTPEKQTLRGVKYTQQITEEHNEVVSFDISISPNWFDKTVFDISIKPVVRYTYGDYASPFSLGYAVPRDYENSTIKTGDLIVARLKLYQDELMKAYSSINAGGMDLNTFRAKRLVEFYNQTTNTVVHSLLMSDCDLENNIGSFYQPYNEYNSYFMYLDAGTVSYILYSHYANLDKGEPIETITTSDGGVTTRHYQVKVKQDIQIKVVVYGMTVDKASYGNDARIEQSINSTNMSQYSAVSNKTIGLLYNIGFAPKNKCDKTEWGVLYGNYSWFHNKSLGTVSINSENDNDLSEAEFVNDFMISVNEKRNNPAVGYWNGFRSTINKLQINDYDIIESAKALYKIFKKKVNKNNYVLNGVNANDLLMSNGFYYQFNNVINNKAPDIVYTTYKKYNYNIIINNKGVSEEEDTAIYFNNFFISDYPIGSHLYNSNINELFIKYDAHNQLLINHAQYPHIAYCITRSVYYDGYLPVMTYTEQNYYNTVAFPNNSSSNSYNPQHYRYVYDSEYQKINDNNLKQLTLDGVIFNYDVNKLTASTKTTHLNLYNTAFLRSLNYTSFLPTYNGRINESDANNKLESRGVKFIFNDIKYERLFVFDALNDIGDTYAGIAYPILNINANFVLV